MKNREIFSKLLNFIDLPETIVIHGSRQVGKTTLMKMVLDFLVKRGESKTLYLDLEKPEFLKLCSQGIDEILGYIKAKLPNNSVNKKTYLFIDEIQYLENPSSLIKLFYDYHKDSIKLIISGSSSFAIKSKFKDSLVGRIIDFEVFGLSFREFLDFKEVRYNPDTESDLADMELKKLYIEYCTFGFYPQVVLTGNHDIKQLYLNGIIEKYIYKDIRDLANIRNIEKFNNLLLFLASQVCGLVNLNELTSTLKIARQTIEEYLFILENTYIIKLLKPFHKNIRGELSRMSKVFFEDNGILNILRNRKLKYEIDGELFENSIYAVMRRKYPVQNIHYWRTTSKQEVDFIISEDKIIAREVKLSEQRITPSGLESFKRKYKDADLGIISLGNNLKLPVKSLYPWNI